MKAQIRKWWARPPPATSDAEDHDLLEKYVFCFKFQNNIRTLKKERKVKNKSLCCLSLHPSPFLLPTVITSQNRYQIVTKPKAAALTCSRTHFTTGDGRTDHGWDVQGN